MKICQLVKRGGLTAVGAVMMGVLLVAVASARGAVVTSRTTLATTNDTFTVSSNDLLQSYLDSVDTTDLTYYWTFPNLYDGAFVPGFATANDVGIEEGTNTFVLDTGTAPEGYRVTEIDTYSGSTASQRVRQTYTVSYSTVGAPAVFSDIATILQGTSGHVSEKWAITEDTAGVLASNVHTIRFIFPLQDPSLNWHVYKEIDIIGEPMPQTIHATEANSTGFTVASNDLLQTSLSSIVDEIDYINLGLGSVTDDPNLINGVFDGGGGGTTGAVGIEGGTNTYILDTSVNYLGYNISSIVTYSGWANLNRAGQTYTVSYSTVDNPTTFVEIRSFPSVVESGSDNSLKISLTYYPSGFVAEGVKAIRFDFGDGTTQQNDGAAYKELDVIGAPVPLPLGTVVSIR